MPKLTNTQDGNNGLHLQVPRGGTHLNGVGCELTFFIILLRSHFCYSWFRLQSIAIHCNRRGVCAEHPYTRLCLDTFILVHDITLWLKVSHGRVCIKRCSCTCHYMSERLLFPCFVSSSVSRASTFSPHFYLSSVLNFNSHDVENAEH